MKKLLIIISLILISLPLFAQVDWEKAYYEEVAAHDETQILYDDLNESHKLLQERHDQTLAQLEVAVESISSTNRLLSSEIQFHEFSKERIELDQEEIGLLRDNLDNMISLADVKMWQVYVQGGLLVNDTAIDLGLNVLIPRTPLAVMFEGNYVVNNGFGVKLGLGVRF